MENKTYAIERDGGLLKVGIRDGAFRLSTMSTYGVWTTPSKVNAELVASGWGDGKWPEPKSSFPPSEVTVVELTFKEA